jgi:hypothetical protein
MFLQRKQLKKPKIGSFAKLSAKTLNNLVSSNYYTENSASYTAEIEGRLLLKSSLRKGKAFNNKVLLADVETFYIFGKSTFSDDYYKVIPLSVRRDSFSGWAIRSLIDKKVSYEIHKDSLVLETKSVSQDRYSFRIFEHVQMKVKSDKYYNIPAFSW